jgi:hypothetical protein
MIEPPVAIRQPPISLQKSARGYSLKRFASTELLSCDSGELVQSCGLSGGIGYVTIKGGRERIIDYNHDIVSRQPKAFMLRIYSSVSEIEKISG